MEFNILVKTQLFPILQKQGFEIVKELKNVICFESSVMRINIAYNSYDRSYLVEIGKKGGILYPLSEHSVKDIFAFELPNIQITSEEFIKKLLIFFEQSKVKEFLKGYIEPLEKFIERESKEYTSELVNKQILKSALQAWENKEYLLYIQEIDRIGVNNVSKSYQFKYDFAKHRLL